MPPHRHRSRVDSPDNRRDISQNRPQRNSTTPWSSFGDPPSLPSPPRSPSDFSPLGSQDDRDPQQIQESIDQLMDAISNRILTANPNRQGRGRGPGCLAPGWGGGRGVRGGVRGSFH